MLDKYGATAETLDRIPFDAWETSFPSLDMMADEILRSQVRSVLLRQNIGEAFEVDFGVRAGPVGPQSENKLSG